MSIPSLVVVAFSIALAASPASADTGGAGPITEYAPFPIPASFSCEVKYDLEGNIWSDQFTGNALGEVNPVTGAVTEVPLPNPGALPGGMERAADGNIYFVEVGGNAIGVLHPEARTISTYPFPWANAEIGGLPLGLPGVNLGLGVPFDLTTGADGAIWFTMVGLNAIGRFDITTHEFQMWPVPTPLSGLIAIEPGPNNTVAFAEGTGNKIGLINVFTHQFTEYPIPTPASLPGGLTTSPDGKTIWFAETVGQKIGALNAVTGQITEYDLLALRRPGSGIPLLDRSFGDPLPSPGQLAFASDGNIYIMEGTFDAGYQVGQFNPQTLAFNELVTPTPLSSPCDLNTEKPGTVIFGEFTGNRIRSFTVPNLGVTPFPL
jgi:virginiamycin B lyase